jgi:hypothetical protein
MITLLARDSHGYYTKTAGKMGNTEADLMGDWTRKKTTAGARVVGLFVSYDEARIVAGHLLPADDEWTRKQFKKKGTRKRG